MPKKSVRRRKFPVFKKLFFTVVILIVTFTATNKLVFEDKSHPRCANTGTCKTDDLVLKIENSAKGYFAGKTIIPPKIALETEITPSPVLGTTSKQGEKHIYVDLKNQTLYAYQGDELILKTLISSGKWGRTPSGNFNVWTKLRATRMSGGSGADYYNLPNVPYVMYFYGDYGLHGAYWHNNFGHTMSHGCVNMRQIDAKVLFEWADGPTKGKLGTPVSVCDEVTLDKKCIQKNPVK